MPFTTPSRFTLITQSQIFFGVPIVDPLATPALLKITWTAPNSFSAASRNPSTSASLATSQCTPITVAPCERISSDLSIQRAVLDVAQHDVHASLRELNGGGEADAAGPARDHGCLALQFHSSSFLVNLSE